MHRVVSRLIAMMLVLFALAKCIELLKDAPFLDYPDPIFSFITKRWVLATVAAIEILVAFVLLMFQRTQVGGFLCIWLGGTFLLYHFLLARIPDSRCACLGFLLSFLPLVKQTTDTIALIAACVIAVSGFFLIRPEEKHDATASANLPSH